MRTPALYKVKAVKPVCPHDPLHVGNFYKDKQRHHKKQNDERQALILYLAKIHKEAMKSKMPLHFRKVPISLTKLRKWVYDYRPAFDYFFEVDSLGYNLGNDLKEITVVTPKIIHSDPVKESKNNTSIITSRDIVYVVPPLPKEGVVSKVYLKLENADIIRKRIEQENRFDLSAPVEWLLSSPIRETNFWFAPSGNLKLRDTSVWPIKGIETWPSWLRVLLFGEGIDIESAYTQFLLQTVKRNIPDSRFALLFPEISRSFYDKEKWREELCAFIGLEINTENIKIIKQITMAMANGTNISGSILTGPYAYSSIKDLLAEHRPEASLVELQAIGDRLSKISKEFKNARKMACITTTQKAATRENQKGVFREYFSWEREARYAIWNSVGQMGIMVHDGIEGIPPDKIKIGLDAMASIGLHVS